MLPGSDGARALSLCRRARGASATRGGARARGARRAGMVRLRRGIRVMADLLRLQRHKLRLNHYYAVDVSQEDINRGVPESALHCALANSLREAGCFDPRVMTPVVSFARAEYRYRGRLDSASLGKDWLFD